MSSLLRTASERASATSLESARDNTVELCHFGRRLRTHRVEVVRTSRKLQLALVFIAVVLDQLLWTTVGKCRDKIWICPLDVQTPTDFTQALDLRINADFESPLTQYAVLSRDSETFVRSFITYVLPLLDYCTPIWSLSSVGSWLNVLSLCNMLLLRNLPYMKCLTYKKRLSAHCLESLELRRLKADLIMCFKFLKGSTNIISSDLLRGRQAILETVLSGFQSYCSSTFFLFVLSNYGINYQKKCSQSRQC